MCGSHFQKILCKNQTTNDFSIHFMEGFIQLFWVLNERNVLLCIYEKCYGSENMLTNGPLIFLICMNPSVEIE